MINRNCMNVVMLCWLMLMFVGIPAARAGWTLMDSGTKRSLAGVWGSSAGDVFAVGILGTILHYDGNPEGTWTAMDNKSS